ncbi:hypothetical protein VTK26DRAFT_8714 [Humicola hyalothermophila]
MSLPLKRRADKAPSRKQAEIEPQYPSRAPAGPPVTGPLEGVIDGRLLNPQQNSQPPRTTTQKTPFWKHGPRPSRLPQPALFPYSLHQPVPFVRPQQPTTSNGPMISFPYTFPLHSYPKPEPYPTSPTPEARRAPCTTSFSIPSIPSQEPEKNQSTHSHTSTSSKYFKTPSANKHDHTTIHGINPNSLPTARTGHHSHYHTSRNVGGDVLLLSAMDSYRSSPGEWEERVSRQAASFSCSSSSSSSSPVGADAEPASCGPAYNDRACAPALPAARCDGGHGREDRCDVDVGVEEEGDEVCGGGRDRDSDSESGSWSWCGSGSDVGWQKVKGEPARDWEWEPYSKGKAEGDAEGAYGRGWKGVEVRKGRVGKGDRDGECEVYEGDVEYAGDEEEKEEGYVSISRWVGGCGAE